MKEKPSISEIILGVLGIGALLTVLFVAPNLVQVIDMFGRKRVYPRRQFRTALRRLEKKGMIRCTSEDTSWKYKLTHNGKRTAEIIFITEYRVRIGFEIIFHSFLLLKGTSFLSRASQQDEVFYLV